jgi:hypothetical protein
MRLSCTDLVAGDKRNLGAALEGECQPELFQ